PLQFCQTGATERLRLYSWDPHLRRPRTRAVFTTRSLACCPTAAGRVHPTSQLPAGLTHNDDLGLEREADQTGAPAVRLPGQGSARYWGAMEQRIRLRESGLERFRAVMPLLKSVCKSPCKRHPFCD